MILQSTTNVWKVIIVKMHCLCFSIMSCLNKFVLHVLNSLLIFHFLSFWYIVIKFIFVSDSIIICWSSGSDGRFDHQNTIEGSFTQTCAYNIGIVSDFNYITSKAVCICRVLVFMCLAAQFLIIIWIGTAYVGCLTL